jgi:hypothetical protein
MRTRSWLTLFGLGALVLAACASPAASPPATDTPEPQTTATAEASKEAASPEASVEVTPKPTPEPAAGELDYQLDPNFGSEELTSGFSPDPFTVEVTSGGPIDASYLGGDCRGWATEAPDFDLYFTAGDLALLRFYFVADAAEDTTLIINAPDADFYCNDDAPGTIDPMVDFTNPDDGLYEVWIGSYEEGTNVAGTLYVTELESNTP